MTTPQPVAALRSVSRTDGSGGFTLVPDPAANLQTPVGEDGDWTADNLVVRTDIVSGPDDIQESTVVLSDTGVYTNVQEINLLADPLVNVKYGFETLANATSLDQTVAIGHQAAKSADGFGMSVVIGHRCCRDATEIAQVVAIGDDVLLLADKPTDIVAIGDNVLELATTGNINKSTAVGHNALRELTAGQNNVSVGSSSGQNLATGTDNTFLGTDAGIDYTTTESNNICIGSRGVVLDNQKIRIGSAQTNTFIKGIHNVTPGGATETVVVDSAGELGSITTPVGTVTASANLTDVALVQGDGGVKGVKSTTITVANNDELNAVQEINLLKELNDNTWYGFEALDARTPGILFNTAFGERALLLLAGGSANNTAIGANALDKLTQADLNIGIGHNAGTNLTGSDSNNIIIGNPGTIGDNQKIIIGDNQTNTFIKGIHNVTPGGATETVIIDSTGQLGSTAVADGDVVGPGASTDDAIARFDGVTGKLLDNSVGILSDAGSLSGLTHLEVIKTATEADDHAVEVCVEAAGFGDVKALQLTYTTGAITSVQDEEAIFLNVDETASTGGRMVGYEVVGTSEGGAEIDAMECGVGCHPIRQQSGTFGNATVLLNIAADVTVALSSGGGGSITVFDNVSETFTVQGAAKFSEMEWVLATGASGSGIAPTFEYSDGSGPTTWASFSPGDGTNGWRNTGVIIWDIADIPLWVVGDSGNFEIRITRTRVGLGTDPVADLVQIAPTTIYTWDKDGDLSVRGISAASSVDGAAVYSLQGSGAGAGTGLDVDMTGKIDVVSSLSNTEAILIDASAAAGGLKVDSGTGGSLLQSTGQIELLSTENSVNSILLDASTNGAIQLLGTRATTAAIVLDASDVNGGMTFSAGTEGIRVASPAGFRFEETGAGTNYIGIKAPAALASDFELTLPVDDGNADEVLTTNGSGVLTWGAGGLPAGYLSGFEQVNATTTTITFGTASETSTCRDVDDTFDIVWSGLVTLTITDTNVAGGYQDSGGNPVGGDQPLQIYAIADSTGVNAPNVLCSGVGEDITTLPLFTGGSYDKLRRIGWARTLDGAATLIPHMVGGKSRSRHFHFTGGRANQTVLFAGSATTWTDMTDGGNGTDTYTAPGSHHMICRTAFGSSASANDEVVFRQNGSTLAATDAEYTFSSGSSLAAGELADGQLLIHLGGDRITEYEVSAAANDAYCYVISCSFGI